MGDSAKRLAIVVPYRDRANHLKQFIPHIAAYFERDKLDKQIPVSIHIVEQFGTAPFNRGKLKNCGYLLVRDNVDYVCFHDVDYLPIWADYSWANQPARLCWYGLTLRENFDNFFGAVVLMSKKCFEAINGYPNCYYGWGREDTELKQRIGFAGFDIERRDGTYLSLPHVHAGYSSPGVLTDEARMIEALYRTRRDHLRELMESDGISSLQFNTVERQPIQLSSRFGSSFHYKVDIGQPVQSS
jgi:hypothetical protein